MDQRHMTAMGACGLMALLGACSPQGVSAPVETPTQTVLAGVDLTRPLTVSGNEPFWSLAIADGKMTYSDPETPAGPTGMVGKPELTGNVAVLRAEMAEASPVTVTLSGTDCSDGMSDRTYPLAARVEMGQRVLHGCAASTEAMARVGETGRVQ